MPNTFYGGQIEDGSDEVASTPKSGTSPRRLQQIAERFYLNARCPAGTAPLAPWPP